ncbi:uncharacterized protein NPIL_558101 [Nephila pilipes]|uniref:SAP domain-containing protein n=1 Tax=Nephila pilipes TaxID=299642 RepID=A0A8X6IGN4_NEPPI|nr:uncharacterized protein NPIL_558101 [Nephila pilipes]
MKKELRFRNLSLTGNKNDLMLRIVEDNNIRKNEGTLDELNTLRMQYFNDEEIPSDRNLLMEIESLRKQVDELIDRATALDAIRSAKQEHKKHSTKSQIRSSYTYDEQRRKYNPITDDVRDITCWRCGIKGHASFMCSLPPPHRGSTIAQPRNTSRQNQYSNSQTSAQFPSSSSSTSSNNHALFETTSLNSSNSRRNNNNRNSTSRRSTTANNPSINCIRTQTNRRGLIPVIINNDTEIQALCDPCADITVIQESCVPSDIVIHPWNDGQFQVVDHEIKPIGWISLNIIVGNVEHMMPKIGICTQLPFNWRIVKYFYSKTIQVEQSLPL